MKLEDGEVILKKVQLSIEAKSAIEPNQSRLNEIGNELQDIKKKAYILKKEFEYLHARTWQIVYNFYPDFDTKTNDSHCNLDFEDSLLYEIKNGEKKGLGDVLSELFNT